MEFGFSFSVQLLGNLRSLPQRNLQKVAMFGSFMKIGINRRGVYISFYSNHSSTQTVLLVLNFYAFYDIIIFQSCICFVLFIVICFASTLLLVI